MNLKNLLFLFWHYISFIFSAYIMSGDNRTLVCKNGYLCKKFPNDKRHPAVVGQNYKIRRNLLETIQCPWGCESKNGGRRWNEPGGGKCSYQRIVGLVVQQQEFLLSSFLLFASGDVLVNGFSIKPNILNNVTIKHRWLCPCGKFWHVCFSFSKITMSPQRESIEPTKYECCLFIC